MISSTSGSKHSYDFLLQLKGGLPVDPLPPAPTFLDPTVPHAPVRKVALSAAEKSLCVRNALRYIPSTLHIRLEPEFKRELDQYGHIYMYRFLPRFPLKAYPIQHFPAKIDECRAVMLMIFNNLDPAVAQYPHELVTYGGNGQVFSNWAQFWLVMKYLSEMSQEQTLSIYSGHPLGVFPSREASPRVILTNGMVIPNYSTHLDYDKFFALGVSQYGQMTAGSYCYIGPQGIVHGTTIILLNAGRKCLNASDSLLGKVYVSSGLGGMSGAQAKAACIAGCIGVIAEVNLEVLKKRFDQGWVMEIIGDLDELIERIRICRRVGHVTSIGYHGNVVALWERLAKEKETTGELLVELGSDQTSLHNPFNGGYYPVQLTFEEANRLMAERPEEFKELVRESLRRQVGAIRKMTQAGTKFWDYGNAFLLEASRAGADVMREDGGFVYPSYVEDIMGDIFSLGFGPFRWVCCSGVPSDLEQTDQAAAQVLREILSDSNLVDQDIRAKYEENLKWIEEAGKHKLVVGSLARILYSDHVGRTKLAKRFNELIKKGLLKGPVVISRDHHDVSGTDSPFRETSNVKDGSKFTADMAVHNFIGDAIRGATWVGLHNGGGVGWGEAINGGFGLLLNGDNSETAENLLLWDVNNGIARRAWAGNENALKAIKSAMDRCPKLTVTLPNF